MNRLSTAVVLAVLVGSAASGRDPEAWLVEAFDRFRAGDIAGAKQRAAAALAEHPRSAILLLGSARIEFEGSRGSNDETALRALRLARTRIETARSMAPAEIPAWAELIAGYALLQDGEVKLARDRFAAAIRLDPLHAESYRLRGQCALDLGDRAAAETDFAAAAERAPSNPDYQLAWVGMLSERGQLSEAIARLWTLDRAMAATATKAERWIVLHRIHELASDRLDFATSRRALDVAVALDPDNVAARLARATLLYRLGDREQARNELQRLLVNEAALPLTLRAEALYRSGVIAQHLGDLVSARDFLERAVMLSGANAAALQSLSSVLFRLGERDAAKHMQLRFARAFALEDEIAKLQEARARKPQDARPAIEVIPKLVELGDAAAAREVWIDLRRRHPEHGRLAELDRLIARSESP